MPNPLTQKKPLFAEWQAAFFAFLPQVIILSKLGNYPN